MMRSSKRRLLAAVLTTVLLAAGCSGKVKPRKPAPLPDIAKPSLRLNEVWSHKVGNGSATLSTRQ